jgi:hypothetical protein
MAETPRTPLSVGMPVIVNYCDRPCARLVAIITAFSEDGSAIASYLSTETGIKKCWEHASKMTPVSDFGMRLEIDRKRRIFWISPVAGAANMAVYSDGRPREWQPETPYTETGREDGIDFHSYQTNVFKMLGEEWRT